MLSIYCIIWIFSQSYYSLKDPGVCTCIEKLLSFGLVSLNTLYHMLHEGYIVHVVDTQSFELVSHDVF